MIINMDNLNTIDIGSPYCVIGRCATVDPVKVRTANRTWFADADEATRHAVELLRRHDNVQKGLAELYVTRIERVVRTPVNFEVLAVERKIG